MAVSAKDCWDFWILAVDLSDISDGWLRPWLFAVSVPSMPAAAAEGKCPSHHRQTAPGVVEVMEFAMNSGCTKGRHVLAHRFPTLLKALPERVSSGNAGGNCRIMVPQFEQQYVPWYRIHRQESRQGACHAKHLGTTGAKEKLSFLICGKFVEVICEQEAFKMLQESFPCLSGWAEGSEVWNSCHPQSLAWF